jgi:hypothetical protein
MIAIMRSSKIYIKRIEYYQGHRFDFSIIPASSHEMFGSISASSGSEADERVDSLGSTYLRLCYELAILEVPDEPVG